MGRKPKPIQQDYGKRELSSCGSSNHWHDFGGTLGCRRHRTFRPEGSISLDVEENT